MALEAHDLTKEIHGRVLYQDIGFLLEKGSSLVIRGASGSGKSQLLRHLSGLDSESDPHLVQSGIVIYEGRDFDDWGAFDWRAQISYVPQQVPRLDGTPAELVRSIADLRAQRSMLTNDPRELAKSFGLAQGLWERPWVELSVGEGQRAMLAIFMARRPGVLLLDEPTAALDEEATLQVEAALADRTCVWVTHSAEQAERVASEVLNLPGDRHAG